MFVNKIEELLPLFYISLSFLCKFEDQLHKNIEEVGMTKN